MIADGAELLPLASLAEQWMVLFANRTRPYALQQADGSYRWVYEELTPQLVMAHLAGEVTLALASTDARGQSRWACLDVDVPGSLPQLLTLCDALGELGLSGLVVGSRRGGHLWLRLDAPVPAMALRYAIRIALDELACQGVEVPAHELYPDTGAVGALGHAVRLPLGIHRKTGVRYPPYDVAGLPCVFTVPARAAAFVLDNLPAIPAARIAVPWAAFLAAGGAHAQREQQRRRAAGELAETRESPWPSGSTRSRRALPALAQDRQAGERIGGRVGTRSAVIRWVDALISPLDLLADLAPESELRPVGRGYLGWCPFHDDRAADAAGLPGTPSFYVVRDRRYGWSWRCLSTNCAFSTGPMKHSFRLWQELLGVSVAAAVVEAAQRWFVADDVDTAGTVISTRDEHAEGEIADGQIKYEIDDRG
jgi:hypothetical protein